MRMRQSNSNNKQQSTMADKNQQNPTGKNTVNPQTGLTPLQEQAAMMLATGETITAVAAKLNVNRCTIYDWQRLLTFQCFLNRQATDYRESLKNGLFGLASDALQTIRDCLHSTNEGNRLKAAMWLIERVNNTDTGETDAREAIRERCTKNVMEVDTTLFDEDEYNKALQWYGLQPE